MFGSSFEISNLKEFREETLNFHVHFLTLTSFLFPSLLTFNKMLKFPMVSFSIFPIIVPQVPNDIQVIIIDKLPEISIVAPKSHTIQVTKYHNDVISSWWQNFLWYHVPRLSLTMFPKSDYFYRFLKISHTRKTQICSTNKSWKFPISAKNTPLMF